MLYIAMGEAFNLMYGYTGYLPFGNIGFFGIGAYVVGILAFLYGIRPPISILIGAMVSMIFSLILYPTLKLKGIYFAICSFLISEAVAIAIRAAPFEITGGPTGISLVDCYNPLYSYYLMLLVMASILIIVHVIDKTEKGLALKAIKENVLIAEMSGVNSNKYKLLAWIINTTVVGICGGLTAWHIAYVNYEIAVSPVISLNSIFLPIIGGTGTVVGPVLGAFFYIPMGTIGLQFSNFFLFIYGVVVLLTVTFLGEGLLPAVQRHIIPALKKHSGE